MILSGYLIVLDRRRVTSNLKPSTAKPKTIYRQTLNHLPPNLKPFTAKLKHRSYLMSCIHDQGRGGKKLHIRRPTCMRSRTDTYVQKEPKIHSATAVPPTIKMLSLFPPITALIARI